MDLQTFKFLVSEDLRGHTLDERMAVGRFPPAEEDGVRYLRIPVTLKAGADPEAVR